MLNRPEIQDVIVQAQISNNIILVGEAAGVALSVQAQQLSSSISMDGEDSVIIAEQAEPIWDERSTDNTIEGIMEVQAIFKEDYGLDADSEQQPGMTAEERYDTVIRLESSITTLMDQAHKIYQNNCYKPGTHEFNPDYVTRLSTNEFLFYTREPLTLEEFEVLQNRIAEKATTLPNGIQLILGSFAVLTHDNAVMNVTPYIRCGQTPQFDFVVKSHTSTIDIRYTQPDGNGGTIKLPILDKEMQESSGIPLPKILINKKETPFQLYNLFECKTPRGTSFLTAIDICLDHYYGVAYSNFGHFMRSNPTAIEQFTSHVLIANHGSVSPAKCIDPLLLHVDPTAIAFKKGTTVQMERDCSLAFGIDEVKIYVIEPSPVLKPSEDLSKILREKLSSILSSLGINIVNHGPPHFYEMRFQNQLTFLCIKKYLENNGVTYFHDDQQPYKIQIKNDFFNISRVEAMISTLSSLETRNQLIHSVRPIQNKYKDFTSTFQQFKTRYKQQDSAHMDSILESFKTIIEQITSLPKLESLKMTLKTHPDYNKLIPQKSLHDRLTGKISAEEAAINDMFEQKKQLLSEHSLFTVKK